MQKKAQNLKPGDVLDDTDPAVRRIILDAYHNIPHDPGRIPGIHQKVRQVRSVRVARKYAYVTLECNAIVRRERELEVWVL